MLALQLIDFINLHLSTKTFIHSSIQLYNPKLISPISVYLMCIIAMVIFHIAPFYRISTSYFGDRFMTNAANEMGNIVNACILIPIIHYWLPGMLLNVAF